MEIFYDIIQCGNLKIQLLVQQNNGWTVVFTINDEDDRRILKAPILENGKVKIYTNPDDAITDAMNRLNLPLKLPNRRKVLFHN
jgi:hypothetical protein